MGKRLLLFGPPGVGKGTHSVRLARDLGVPHVATGDMFRDAVRKGAAYGQKLQEFLARGALVPDELAVAMVDERLSEPDAAGGYLLDGFPRTVPQAVALAQRLRTNGASVDVVLALEAPEDVLVARISGRLSCGSCGGSFNKQTRPPKEAGRCDLCGSTLFQRSDDKEDVVRRRLGEYRMKTAPVLAFLKSENWAVRTVLSVGEPEVVYFRIREAAEA